MKNFLLILLTLALTTSLFAGDHPTQTLTLRWRPAASDNPNCGVTEQALDQAVRTLTKALKPAGMAVQLGHITTAAGESSSATDLWINNVPMETWLNAELRAPAEGSDGDCPALRVGVESYTKIPAELIVKAGLTAAGKLLAAEPVDAVSVVVTSNGDR